MRFQAPALSPPQASLIANARQARVDDTPAMDRDEGGMDTMSRTKPLRCRQQPRDVEHIDRNVAHG
jgi:hypothetical protein